MSDQWLQDWFPVVGLMLQTVLWGLIIPRFASRRTVALLTFSRLPEDPTW